MCTVVSGPVSGCDTTATATNDDQIVLPGHPVKLMPLAVQPSLVPGADREGRRPGIVEGSLRRKGDTVFRPGYRDA